MSKKYVVALSIPFDEKFWVCNEKAEAKLVKKQIEEEVHFETPGKCFICEVTEEFELKTVDFVSEGDIKRPLMKFVKK